MKFSEEELRQLTFPKAVFGYRKNDVEDFVYYVAKDYQEYNREFSDVIKKTEKMNEKIFELEKIIEEKDRQLLQQEIRLVQRPQPVKPVVQSVKEVYGEVVQEYSLAQQVVLEIERVAKRERQQLLSKAEEYYVEQVELIGHQKREIEEERQKMLEYIHRFENEVTPLVEQTRQACIVATKALENVTE